MRIECHAFAIHGFTFSHGLTHVVVIPGEVDDGIGLCCFGCQRTIVVNGIDNHAEFTDRLTGIFQILYAEVIFLTFLEVDVAFGDSFASRIPLIHDRLVVNEDTHAIIDGRAEHIVAALVRADDCAPADGDVVLAHAVRHPLSAFVEIDLLVVGGVSRLTLEFGVVVILNFECRLTEAYTIGGRILSANPGFR